MLWNAQCRFLRTERSEASGDLMPCSRAFQQRRCFPAWTHILHFNKQSVPEEKIPVSTDTGSGLASFFFFCKLLPKQQGAQNPHERHQQQHSRGSQVFFHFNSTSRGASDHKLPFGDSKEKRQHLSFVQMPKYDRCLHLTDKGPLADLSVVTDVC